ncbi:MAG TPA: hypothetical protein VLH39_03585 [Magnetospirillaceae bacterium]|nr:hypothetical protein [Magnetospirillaceae bacterium]
MKEIRVTYPDGKSQSFPFLVKAADAIGPLGALPRPLAAVLINNELCPLDYFLTTDCTMAPVTVDTALGAVTYRRSLCYLLAMASRQIFSDRRLVAGMAIGTGFFHFFDDDRPDAEADIAALDARMRELVAADIPIRREWMSYSGAVDYFRLHGQTDTLLLLEHMNDPRIALNECAGFRDLHVTPLVPSTGVLSVFELVPYHDGFLLRYPHKEDDKVPPFQDDPVLYRIAVEYRERGKILGISSVGALNAINSPKLIKEYIQIAEVLQNKKMAELADQVAARAETVKVLLIAGPSSSGKTTTSKKLAIQLKVMGLKPVVIALDDYFVDRDRTPRDENGDYDFECLEALDVGYLNEQLVELFRGDEIELPAFDFRTGTRRPSGRKLRLSTGREIVVMEGIHGLNDRLTPRIPRERKFKVYVSALTQLNLDDHNRISTTDNRLLRRIVRDCQFRGKTALDTLRMWASVQRGEQRHIFPFQNTADAAFNSALDYELGVLKIYSEPLLRTVKPTVPEYAEAGRLLGFLANFSPIPAQFVPGNSILREFIGESEFKY